MPLSRGEPGTSAPMTTSGCTSAGSFGFTAIRTPFTMAGTYSCAAFAWSKRAGRNDAEGFACSKTVYLLKRIPTSSVSRSTGCHLSWTKTLPIHWLARCPSRAVFSWYDRNEPSRALAYGWPVSNGFAGSRPKSNCPANALAPLPSMFVRCST